MNITNINNLPEAYYRNCLRDDHPRFDMDTFSVTELQKGVKEIILTHRHWNELTQDCSDMVWLILGKAVHKVFEGSEGEHEISEARLSTTVQAYDPKTGAWDKKITISGGFDLYNGQTFVITDYKTTQTFGYQMKLQEGTQSEWYKQLQKYWYILGKNGFEVRSGQIVVILKDWSKAKARIDRDYPQLPVQIVKYKSFGGSEEAMLLEQDIVDKVHEILSQAILPDDEIPPCTKDERWEKGEKWAVMKDGRKSAVRLHDSETEAQRMVDDLGKGHSVVHRPGIPVKCVDYCQCCEFCSFYRDYMEAQNDIQTT